MADPLNNFNDTSGKLKVMNTEEAFEALTADLSDEHKAKFFVIFGLWAYIHLRYAQRFNEQCAAMASLAEHNWNHPIVEREK